MSKNIFKDIYERYIRPEKFEAIGHKRIYWLDENGRKISTMTIIFVLGDKGTRKIDLEYDKWSAKLYGHPKEHNWYRHYSIPYLKKLEIFHTDDAHKLRMTVEYLCYGEDFVRQKYTVKSKTPVIEGNVVKLFDDE